ncbi:hypothetical protein BJ546DRAFT_518873 [Cryomyces antarcticus]
MASAGTTPSASTKKSTSFFGGWETTKRSGSTASSSRATTPGTVARIDTRQTVLDPPKLRQSTRRSLSYDLEVREDQPISSPTRLPTWGELAGEQSSGPSLLGSVSSTTASSVSSVARLIQRGTPDFRIFPVTKSSESYGSKHNSLGKVKKHRSGLRSEPYSSTPWSSSSSGPVATSLSPLPKLVSKTPHNGSHVNNRESRGGERHTSSKARWKRRSSIGYSPPHSTPPEREPGSTPTPKGDVKKRPCLQVGQQPPNSKSRSRREHRNGTV